MTEHGCSRSLRARETIAILLCAAAIASSATAGVAVDAAQPLRSSKATRAHWKLIKAAVRACVMGEHDLCRIRMSELSATLRALPGSDPSLTSGEVRDGMFQHPTAPDFHQLRAIFKSGKCDPSSATWVSSGTALSTDALRALFPAAEEQLNAPAWGKERKELEQFRQSMEACFALSPGSDPSG